MNIPFLLSSAYEQATLNEETAFAGSANVGKPASAKRLLATLASLLQARTG